MAVAERRADDERKNPCRVTSRVAPCKWLFSESRRPGVTPAKRNLRIGRILAHERGKSSAGQGFTTGQVGRGGRGQALYGWTVVCFNFSAVNPARCFACLLCLASGFVAGCSSPQFSRIERSREAYESWPLEMRQAVLDGRIEPGMTPEMVEVAWGKPDEVIARRNGPHEDEIWIYRKTSGGDYVYPTTPIGGYPSGYPGGYPVGVGGRSTGVSVGVGTGGGTGVSVGTGGIGVGVGTGGVGMGGVGMGGVMAGGPIMVRPPVTTEREVVIRDGVVIRADQADEETSPEP